MTKTTKKQEPQYVPVADEQVHGIDDKKTALANIGQSIALSLVPGKLSREQIRAIRARTPEKIIKSVPIGGGKQANYVPAPYYIRKLNFVFGYGAWSFVIVSKDVIEDQAVVHGELIVESVGIKIGQFGGHPAAREIVAFEKDGISIDRWKFYKTIKKEEQDQWTRVYGHYVDLGNTLKAAATDAFKKCCSMLGMFSDVYAPDDFVEVQPEVSAEAEMRTVREIIAKEKSVDVLNTIAEKIRKSDKYSEDQRDMMLAELAGRIGQIPDELLGEKKENKV